VLLVTPGFVKRSLPVNTETRLMLFKKSELITQVGSRCLVYSMVNQSHGVFLISLANYDNNEWDAELCFFKRSLLI
jgi:hypothetical protein